MVEVQPIRTTDDYDRALARLWEVFDAAAGTPEADECDALADLVAAYDDRHYPIPDPSPADIIQGRLDALGLAEDDLISSIGSREKVAEVLTGQREVTPDMAWSLHQLLGVTVADLLPAGWGFPAVKPVPPNIEQRVVAEAKRMREEEKV